MAEGAQRWTRQHGAEFVTNVTQTQIEGIRAAVKYAASGAMTVDKLAQIVRPMVGLTRPQTTALSHYLNSMLQQGVSAKTARHKVLRRAEEMHRQRAYTIAQTELAFAYNRGAIEGIRQAQKLGYMGAVQKRWRTADDARVCIPICQPLNGVLIGLDELFNFPTKLTEECIREMPPAHPNCGCAVAFEEVTAEGAKTAVDYGEEVKGNEPVRLISEPAKRDEKRSDTGLQFVDEYDTEDVNPKIDRAIKPFGALLQIPNGIESAERKGKALSEYLNDDGILQQKQMQEDYEKFLQTMPANSIIKILLGRALYEVPYLRLPLEEDEVVGYLGLRKAILYDPLNKSFGSFYFFVVNTHELSHYIDHQYVHSWRNKDFLESLRISKERLLKNPEKFIRFSYDRDHFGFISDIFNAICEGEYVFITGHPKEYWNDNKQAKVLETFANLLSLEAFQDEDSLAFLLENLPELIQAYQQLEFQME